MGNDPVNAWDPLGLKIWVAPGIDPNYKKDVEAMLDWMEANMDDGCDLVKRLRESDMIHTISEYTGDHDAPANYGNGRNSRTEFQPDDTDSHHGYSPESVLMHELQHAWDKDQGIIDRTENPNSGVSIAEERAVRAGNAWRRRMGEEQKTTYAGKKVDNPFGNPCP